MPPDRLKSSQQLSALFAAWRCARNIAATVGLAWLLAGAAPPPPAQDWEQRLAGDSIVLLGEIHDNADGQQLRLAALQRAIERGWRPAIAMEQFDIDRQADIDRARSERPGDASHLIKQAGGTGWDWSHYRPVVQLALDHELPLLAANLPRALSRQLVRAGASEVLGETRSRELGLDRPLAPEWQAAQEREIDLGHCGALPPAVLPGMARAQAARDAVMAELLARHRSGGIVLLAGNGHVRLDLGVPRWLEHVYSIPSADYLAVAYLEAGGDAELPVDESVTISPRADRPDPCAQFRK